MECFLRRLASSQYSNCFIVKGGFLLSSILGVKKRTTVDIDFSAQSISISPDILLVIINEIISIDLEDSISYECINILPIRKTDEYGGNQICLIAHLDNIRHRINIDIATGDPITPSAVNYAYLHNTIQQLETSSTMEKLWINYTKKHSFANLITYSQITQRLYRILELI